MEWRSVTSRYHGSKISSSPQSFLKEKGICLGERWKNSMEYRFVLECIQAPENHTFQSFCFPPYLQHHSLLRSRNFATMTTWRNDFSSLLLELMQRRFWTTHVNRKSILFHLKLPWSYQICIPKCLYYYTDNLFKNWGKPPSKNAQKKTTNGWRASLKKRLCLSFILVEQKIQGT